MLCRLPVGVRRAAEGGGQKRHMLTQTSVPGRRLNGVDAAFLYLERKELPLSVAALLVFDRPVPFKRFIDTVDSRLPLLPRYRQVVVAPPFDAGYPTWEDDPQFDIRRHIFRARLDPPGGEAELEAFASRILSQMLDRGKPLWDIHVISGLKGGRGALLVRVHHCLVDGISGAALIKAMLDPTPGGSQEIRSPRARSAGVTAPQPSLAEAIISGIRTSLDHLISAEAGVLRFFETLLADQGAVKDIALLLPELMCAVERLPFNKPCTGERKFCWAEIDFSEVKAIRAAAGGTVNDVILTVLTRAIARYTVLHGQTVTNRLIRVVCPVNTRRDGDQSVGNQITFMPVVLPMDVQDPVRMLQAVAARTALMKRIRAAEMISLIANCFGAAPPPVQAMLWKGISQVSLPVPLFNTICTNVPGSSETLYCAGRRLIAAYPHVPTGYELGVNCAVTSYCGKLYFGLIADANIAPDVHRLRDFLCDAFNELCRAAGVRQQRAKPAPARKRSPRAKRAAGNRGQTEVTPIPDNGDVPDIGSPPSVPDLDSEAGPPVQTMGAPGAGG